MGSYAGAYALGGDLIYRMPVLGLKRVYLKAGMAIVDTKSLTPTMAWRKFAPLQLDGILYLSDIYYVGGGINYPVKVSDGLTPNWGAQVYIGANHYTGDGRLYADFGYSVLRIKDHPSFKGMHAMVGYRYDYSITWISEAPREPAPEIPVQEEKEVVEMALGSYRAPAEVVPALPPPRVVRRVERAVPKRIVTKPRPNRVFHYVSRGDTLYAISRKYFGNERMAQKIARENGISNPNYIKAGSQLLIDFNWAR
jgi:hypothetical protein